MIIYSKSSGLANSAIGKLETPIIDAFGAVAGVSVVVSSGFKELDKAAVKAVEAAKFNPASRNGKKVESSVSLTFVFKLK